jgi:hypothetical protein
VRRNDAFSCKRFHQLTRASPSLARNTSLMSEGSSDEAVANEKRVAFRMGARGSRVASAALLAGAHSRAARHTHSSKKFTHHVALRATARASRR